MRNFQKNSISLGCILFLCVAQVYQYDSSKPKFPFLSVAKNHFFDQVLFFILFFSKLYKHMINLSGRKKKSKKISYKKKGAREQKHLFFPARRGLRSLFP